MNFKEFLNEAVDPVLDTREKVEAYIASKKARFGGGVISIRNDLTVDVGPPPGERIKGVNLSGLKFRKIPLKFGVIDGELDVSNTNITSFENAPYSSRGIKASKCTQLTSLKGLPSNIYSLDISECTALKSLEGVPRVISHALVLDRCSGLESLHNISEMIGTCRYLSIRNMAFRHSILGLVLLKETSIWSDWSDMKTSTRPSDRALTIINDCIRGNEEVDIFTVQEKLVNAGLAQYAEL